MLADATLLPLPHLGAVLRQLPTCCANLRHACQVEVAPRLHPIRMTMRLLLVLLLWLLLLLLLLLLLVLLALSAAEVFSRLLLQSP
jgi:hypothetical protein